MLTIVTGRRIGAAMRRGGFLTAAVLSAVAGCHPPVSPTQLSTARVELGRTDCADQVWEAARSTVRDAGFRATIVDRGSGRFATEPLLSEHFFEVWRHDVHTPYDWLESTIAPIRRKVEVSVTPTDDPTASTLDVTVTKERLSSPDRQFNESGAIFQFFGYVLPSASTGQPISAQQDRWVDIGRDGAMEQYLIDRIVRYATRDAGARPRPEPPAPVAPAASDAPAPSDAAPPVSNPAKDGGP